MGREARAPRDASANARWRHLGVLPPLFNDERQTKVSRQPLHADRSSGDEAPAQGDLARPWTGEGLGLVDEAGGADPQGEGRSVPLRLPTEELEEGQ